MEKQESHFITVSGLEKGRLKRLDLRCKHHQILYYLLKGEQFTSLALMHRFSVCDPQAEIRRIRAAGYPVGDKWVHGPGVRPHKIYFME